MGTIYFCATPIGNLEDITLRVLNTLKTVDCIAAEDTRHTIKLLNHYEISKPMVSLHQHNENQRSGQLIARVKRGESIAVVSDAGMPLISDPGFNLVRMAKEEGVPITVLPGASAGVTALALSGLDTRRFVFEGFLPEKKKERDAWLKQLMEESRTTIFYESPHALKKTLKAIAKVCSSRQIVLARELTKKFEETLNGTADELLTYYDEKDPRGEYVVLVEGSTEKKISYDEQLSVKEHIQLHISEGMTKKEAIKQVAKDRGVAKSDVYKESLDL
jgi:16S rRNA (cytidine1402-2'-O)-methyltransferase